MSVRYRLHIKVVQKTNDTIHNEYMVPVRNIIHLHSTESITLVPEKLSSS